MNEMNLFEVILKVNEENEPNVKIEFDGELETFIPQKELFEIMDDEDQMAVAKIVDKIITRLQERIGEENE